MIRDELDAVMAAHDLFDGWLLFHAYRAYGRDYELIVTLPAGLHHTAGVFSYLFRPCVVAETRSLIRPETWNVSLDDRLTSFDAYRQAEASGAALVGFIWAQGATLYSGHRVERRGRLL